LGLYLLAVAIPLLAAWVAGTGVGTDALTRLATATGVAALALLAVALILPARVHALVACFGIEKILRGHKLMAMLVVGLVAAHVVLVLLSDPRGLAILDLRDTTAAAGAATLSTVALACVVVLALRRRRRQPRYEGWRVMHVFLAAVVFTAAALHVWWLDQLVADPVFGTWFVLLVGGMLVLALRRWVWLPLRAHRRSYVVEEVRPAGGNAVTVVVRAHGHAGLPFRAGQFAWLKIGSSSFVFEEHPFSIASTAERPHLKEFTIKALGDFTELLAALRPGRRVFLDGPYGRFTMEGLKSDGFVLIAGGVGITPMLSMLRTLSDRGDKRHHQLIVGARTADDILLRQEVEALRKRLDLEVTEIVESPGPGWGGETGRIDADLLERRLPPHRKHHDYFLCGPAPMVAAVGHELREHGIPVRRIHTEQFETV
jgi:predicted ferric reductase